MPADARCGLDDKLATEFDNLIATRGSENRSEAVRDLLRNELDRSRRNETPKATDALCA